MARLKFIGLFYTFPWRQPESTRGACPFDVACGPLWSGGTFMLAGRNFEEILQHLKKKKRTKKIF